MAKETTLEWHDFKTIAGEEGRIATLVIDRPDRANAFSAALMAELGERFQEVRAGGARVLLLTGRGKHFSAGADLAWMQASAKLSYDENIADAKRLTAMFESLAALPMPVIGVVKGAAYGGAVGLVACCDVVVADASAKFCLSELRLGLLPAVIVPYLSRRMSAADLRRFALTAKVFSPEEARQAKLVDVVAPPGQLEESVRDELSRLCETGPAATAALKELLRRFDHGNRQQADDTAHAIAAARVGAEGQAGLKAYFAKDKAPWCASPSSWSLPKDD